MLGALLATAHYSTATVLESWLYLAAFVTAGVVLVTRVRTGRRGKERARTDQVDAWRRVLAPMTLPPIPAPARPAPPARGAPRPDGPGDGLDHDAPLFAGASEKPSGLVGDATGAADALATTSADDEAEHSAPSVPEETGPSVSVLGPVAVRGWRQAPDRRIVTELAVYLALHRDRPRSAEELLEALWPPSDDGPVAEPGTEVVHQAVSRLRRCLGPDAVPDAALAGGYVLAGNVACDWERFEELVGEAHTAPDATTKLRAALELVTGPPFSGLRREGYAWVFSELWASRLTAAVVQAAHDLVTRSLTAGDNATAEWAASRGLAASATEELLHEDRLRAAAAAHDVSRLERVWAEARRALGAQADTSPVATTYARLREGLRTSG